MSRRSSKGSRLKRFKTLLRVGLFFLFILTLLSLAWAFKTYLNLKNSTKSGWFQPATEIYTAPLAFKPSQQISPQRFQDHLHQLKYTERGPEQNLSSKEFTFFSDSLCRKDLNKELHPNTRSCFFIKNKDQNLMAAEFSYSTLLRAHKWDVSKQKFISVNSIATEPLLVVRLSQNTRILRTFTSLAQMPRYCLDAVLAIEDDRFLKHKGISPKGILRAALNNLKSGRAKQGGSTLTQQLVKNKFLTAEKTLKRKLQEAWLSLLLELVLTKEEILEAYLNYIYFGRSGGYSVHGLPEASKLYFNKPMQQLGLAECSLLAGAIKGPGIYGPHKSKSKPRQKQVLDRMLELNLISKTEHTKAWSKKVKVATVNHSPTLKVQAPYYIEALLYRLKEVGFPSKEGLKIFSEMDYFAQSTLEKKIDSFLKGHGQKFLGSLLVGDNNKNTVIALTSGTSSSRNFNSALFGKRQIGSLAKPFVYLTAFEKLPDFTPLTELSNAPFTYRYQGQKWTPKNYSSKDSLPNYPAFEALAKSKNIPTVRLMHQFGHKAVYQNLMHYGFSEFAPITPSLALGSFEASPLEVLKAYINLSKSNGDSPYKTGPFLLNRVESLNGQVLYNRPSIVDFNHEISSARKQLLQLTTLTLKIGTAKRAQQLNLKGQYGGKTGTTNQHKDGWFSAFSSDYTYVVWVGKAPYLKPHQKLTGASAALPLWLQVIPDLEAQGRVPQKAW